MGWPDGSVEFSTELQHLLQSEENGTDYFVSFDVSLRSVAVCVIDPNGKRVFERCAACEIEDIVAGLRDAPTAQCGVGFEPGVIAC